MIQPSCVSLTELDLCHQPAFPNIFYHTMQSYVLQVFELVATTAAERRLRTARPRQGSNMRKKRRYPSDISSFSHLIESTRRRRTSGGRSTATTGAERRHSNRSNPAGLEHTKKEVSNGYLLFCIIESTRRDSNPRPSPWQGDTPPLSHSCIDNIPSKPHIEFHQPLNLHLTFLDKPSTD